MKAQSYSDGNVLVILYACSLHRLFTTDAFAIFTPEIIEFKLKEATKVYRVLVNYLIDGYEKLAYQQKEDSIEFIPRLLEAKERTLNP